MRVSRLSLVTLRNVPADAEIPSHQLLVRGGYIRRVGPGLYAYLPPDVESAEEDQHNRP